MSYRIAKNGSRPGPERPTDEPSYLNYKGILTLPPRYPMRICVQFLSLHAHAAMYRVEVSEGLRSRFVMEPHGEQAAYVKELVRRSLERNLISNKRDRATLETY